MKRCSTCHELKRLHEFNRRASSRDGRQPRCRSCSRSWYEVNRETHKANARRRSDELRVTNRKLMKDYLVGHPCVDCGETDIRVLDFDHRPGEQKLADVGSLLAQGFCWRTIEGEIAKCDVRCANCHRIITCERANNWRQKASIIAP
jgi:hypothetical protein